MAADETLEKIRQALADFVPRRADLPTATPAAVLILIHGYGEEARILFTERTDQVEHHKGQVSFPGGACDDGDDCLETTALRETEEELGVRAEDIEIIGQLDDIVTISNYRVTPFVGVLAWQPDYPMVLNEREVAQVVEVPVGFLLDERNMELEVRQHQGREVLVPAFSYNGHRIWGATARMLHQLIELLR